jgi:hypothetical protein
MIDIEDVNVVCGTTTLAQGVNLPIASVIVETLQKPREPNGRQDLDFSEFWNIAGRAGRALRDRLGQVVYPAENANAVESFRRYIQNDARALSSVLVEALEGVDAAAEEFDLAFVRRNRAMAVFTQYLGHALSVGGYENARAEIEDLLRSSLVYHQTSEADPPLARELITLARRYIDSVSTKTTGYLRLADGLVAGVIADWTAGVTVEQIADSWFASAEPDPDRRRRLAGHYLYSRLVGRAMGHGSSPTPCTPGCRYASRGPRPITGVLSCAHQRGCRAAHGGCTEDRSGGPWAAEGERPSH